MIPVDEVTADTVRDAGWELDEVLPVNERLTVRRTANLHTGGTIRDVTDEVNPPRWPGWPSTPPTPSAFPSPVST